MAKTNTDFIERTGKIIKIDDQKNIAKPGASPSYIRSFVIEVTRTWTTKENEVKEIKDYLPIETKDKMIEQINARQIGDTVTVSFLLGGKKWKDSFFVKLNCTRITLVQPAAAPMSYQQPQGYAPQGSYPQQPNYQQPAYPQQCYQQPQTPHDDFALNNQMPNDLPF